MEIDELHPYIRPTQTTARPGLLLTELGKDLLATFGQPLYCDRMIVVGAIQDKNIDCLRTDYWPLDQHFVPEEMQRKSKSGDRYS